MQVSTSDAHLKHGQLRVHGLADVAIDLDHHQFKIRWRSCHHSGSDSA